MLLADDFRQIRYCRSFVSVDEQTSWTRHCRGQLCGNSVSCCNCTVTCVSKNVAVMNNMQLNCISMPTGCCSWATAVPTQSDGDIHLPDELCVSSVDDLVEYVFGDLSAHHNDAISVSSRAILCPCNDMVDHMNDRVLDIPGDTVTYLSADSVAEVDQQSVYPTEYLNSLTLSGLPPHKLSIKLGTVKCCYEKWTRRMAIVTVRAISSAKSDCEALQLRLRAANIPAIFCLFHASH